MYPKINKESVYVVTSPLYKNNIFKIGYSTQGMNGIRKRYGTELGEVNIKYYYEFKKYTDQENRIHIALANYRVWSNREIFQCPYSIVDYELAKLDGRYNRKCACSRWWWDKRIKLKKSITPKVKTTKVIYA